MYMILPYEYLSKVFCPNQLYHVTHDVIFYLVDHLFRKKKYNKVGKHRCLPDKGEVFSTGFSSEFFKLICVQLIFNTILSKNKNDSASNNPKILGLTRY